MSVIGKSIRRVDAYDKVTGTEKFAGDFHFPGMLHIKLVYSQKPHAQIKSIDTKKTEKMPGVKAVLTFKDVPNNLWGIVKKDREVLSSSVVRYVGDRVAAVVAESPAQAKAAAESIEIDFQDLPVIDDPLLALNPKAFQIHKDCPKNILFSQDFQLGDVEKAFEQADVIVKREYSTPMQEHAFLETEAGVAYVDEGEVVTVICGGQGAHDDQQQIAEALRLPLEKVRVIYPAIGGAFGGKEEISIQIILALAAFKLNKPVKLVWDRTESIIGHCKRHAMILRYKWAAKNNGKITAAKMEVIADAGAYEYGSITVLKNYLFGAIGPYQIPNIQLDTKAVYTNNVPGGAFRGYGFPQITFASELQIAHLAEELKIDPVTMRLVNCYREGSTLPTMGKVPQGVNIAKLISDCASEIGYQNNAGKWASPPRKSNSSHLKRGVGIAAGMKNSGFALGFPEGSKAKIVLRGGSEIEQVELLTAAADVGQGAHTVLCQIAAEALNISSDIIQLITSDTAMIGDSGPASASRLTLYAGNAVKFAAQDALKKWQEEERPAIGYFHWKAPATSSESFNSPPDTPVNSITYGAQAVEVEVNTQTGEIAILKVVAAHDPGKMVNPQQVEGQIEGGIIQALGWSLMENFITREGEILTDQLSTYLIPTAMDIPDQILSIIDEQADPIGPYGIRGIGEIPFIPLAPAIVAAVRNATGVWVDQIPITPGLFLQKISNKTKLPFD